MQEFKNILKKNILKYFLLALLSTILSYMYIRYGWASLPCTQDMCSIEWDIISWDFRRGIQQYPVLSAGLPIPYAFSSEPFSTMDIVDDYYIWSIFFLDIFLWMLIFTTIRYFREKCQGDKLKKPDEELPSSPSPKPNEN